MLTITRFVLAVSLCVAGCTTQADEPGAGVAGVSKGTALDTLSAPKPGSDDAGDAPGGGVDDPGGDTADTGVGGLPVTSCDEAYNFCRSDCLHLFEDDRARLEGCYWGCRFSRDRCQGVDPWNPEQPPTR